MNHHHKFSLLKEIHHALTHACTFFDRVVSMVNCLTLRKSLDRIRYITELPVIIKGVGMQVCMQVCMYAC